MRTSPATVLVIEKHPLMRAAIVNNPDGELAMYEQFPVVVIAPCAL